MPSTTMVPPQGLSSEGRRQWLEGKPTRREVIGDVSRIEQGLRNFASAVGSQSDLHEGLVRYLVEHPVRVTCGCGAEVTATLISVEDYQAYVAAQGEFREFVDSLRATGDGVDMPAKVRAALVWNTTPGKVRVRGDWVPGIVAYLSRSLDTVFTVRERAEAAQVLGVPVEEVLTPQEQAKLEKEDTDA